MTESNSTKFLRFLRFTDFRETEEGKPLQRTSGLHLRQCR